MSIQVNQYPKVAIILGSSNSTGNTFQIASALKQELNGEIYDLNQYQILPFDYHYHNQDDDFNPLIEQLLSYDCLVFASPVYWYAPSAQLKVFMDRLSDLLNRKKERGRQLRKMSAALISTGCDQQVKSCFIDIFTHTFAYLGMRDLGSLYCSCKEEISLPQYLPKLRAFALRFK